MGGVGDTRTESAWRADAGGAAADCAVENAAEIVAGEGCGRVVAAGNGGPSGGAVAASAPSGMPARSAERSEGITKPSSTVQSDAERFCNSDSEKGESAVVGTPSPGCWARSGKSLAGGAVAGGGTEPNGDDKSNVKDGSVRAGKSSCKGNSVSKAAGSAGRTGVVVCAVEGSAADNAASDDWSLDEPEDDDATALALRACGRRVVPPGPASGLMHCQPPATHLRQAPSWYCAGESHQPRLSKQRVRKRGAHLLRAFLLCRQDERVSVDVNSPVYGQSTHCACGCERSKVSALLLSRHGTPA